MFPPWHESPWWAQWVQTHEFSAWGNNQEETSAESTLGRLVTTCVCAQCREKERKTNKQKSRLVFARCFSADHLPWANSTAASWEEIQSLSNQTHWKINLQLKPLRNNTVWGHYQSVLEMIFHLGVTWFDVLHWIIDYTGVLPLYFTDLHLMFGCMINLLCCILLICIKLNYITSRLALHCIKPQCKIFVL